MMLNWMMKLSRLAKQDVELETTPITTEFEPLDTDFAFDARYDLGMKVEEISFEEYDFRAH